MKGHRVHRSLKRIINKLQLSPVARKEAIQCRLQGHAIPSIDNRRVVNIEISVTLKLLYPRVLLAGRTGHHDTTQLGDTAVRAHKGAALKDSNVRI